MDLNLALQDYASFLIQAAVEIQKNNELIIQADVEQAPLVKHLVEAAYKAGAATVRVDWGMEAINRLHYQHQSEDRLSEVAPWLLTRYAQDCDRRRAILYVHSADPEALVGIDPALLSRIRQKHYAVLHPHRDRCDAQYVWVIAAAASPAWAAHVFPDLSPEAGTEALWQAIFKACGLDLEQGVEHAVQAWHKHQQTLERRAAQLSELDLRKLTYHSSNGTHFTCELIPGVRWGGGGESTQVPSPWQQHFSPNVPTEEVFTSPFRGRAEGWVVATKPLSWNGQLIEQFRIRFEAGRAVEWSAERGEEALSAMLTLDEGAAYLGEVALVPQSSPIQQSGLLFHETLFDENASCHLAVGRAFADLLPGALDLSDEEKIAKGLNVSLSHVDFMIGSDDLCITAEDAKGQTHELFVNGEWAEAFR